MRDDVDDEVTSPYVEAHDHNRQKKPRFDHSGGSGDGRVRRSKSPSPGLPPSEEFCKQAPPIFESFVNVIFDHAVGEQILGPTKNPCPSFFSSRAKGSVWTKDFWGNYYRFQPEEHRYALPHARRLVAVGDLHGDIEKTRKVLEIAKLLGKDDQWIGKNALLVQVGDIFDRGGGELKILYLLEKLRRGALRKGGDIHILHGNHETETVLGRFKYATREAFLEFHNWYKWYKIYNRLKLMVDGCSPIVDWEKGLPTVDELEEWEDFEGLNMQSPVGQGILGRLTAMRPGGPVTRRFLAPCPAILVIEKSLFVHGGMRSAHLPNWNSSVVQHNKAVTEWLKGKSGFTHPDIITFNSGKFNAITWNRDYGREDGRGLPCQDLELTLLKSGATGRLTGDYKKRMLIGHTIQHKRMINAACGGLVIRLDVGMSKGCLDNKPQALEIRDDKHFVVLEEEGDRLLTFDDPSSSYLNKLFADDDDDDTNSATSPTPKPAEASASSDETSSDSFKTAPSSPSPSPSPERLSLGDLGTPKVPPEEGSGDSGESSGDSDKTSNRERRTMHRGDSHQKED